MKPDKPKTTFSLLVREGETKTPPTIIFNTTALKWIRALVESHPYEVGFYAVVDERENYTFYVRDVFYPKHSEMNGATCEISEEGEHQVMNWLMDHGRDDDIPKMRLWGHSHHTMTTGPSGQDEKQAMERMNSTKAFLIRVICVKGGEMACTFFDYDRNVRFDHVKWKVEEDSDISYYESKIDEITAVLTTNKNAKNKIKEINQLISTDNQYELIKEKVEDLKNVNMPQPTAKSKSSGKQENLFKNNSENYEDMDFPRSGSYYEEDLEEEFRNRISRDDQSEIGKMINNWENGVGVIK